MPIVESLKEYVPSFVMVTALFAGSVAVAGSVLPESINRAYIAVDLDSPDQLAGTKKLSPDN